MNDFYEIVSRATIDGTDVFFVRINRNHPVFQGHFPGMPIVPGVMTMMLIRECAEMLLGTKTHFANISQCKYLGLVVPDNQPIGVYIKINDKTVNAEVIGDDQSSLMKLKATLA